LSFETAFENVIPSWIGCIYTQIYVQAKREQGRGGGGGRKKRRKKEGGVEREIEKDEHKGRVDE